MRDKPESITVKKNDRHRQKKSMTLQERRKNVTKQIKTATVQDTRIKTATAPERRNNVTTIIQRK